MSRRSHAMRFSRRNAMTSLLVATVIGTSALMAQNAPTTVGPVQLTIPEGFEFAKSGHQEGMEVSAWTQGAAPNGTLLQVSIVDMGSQLPSATPAELAEGATKYLQQF